MVPASTWTGIGLSAMIPTLVMTDSDLRPLASAITWEDGRAESLGEDLRNAGGADLVYEQTGQWVDGRYLLPMAARLMAEQPETAGSALAPRCQGLPVRLADRRPGDRPEHRGGFRLLRPGRWCLGGALTEVAPPGAAGHCGEAVAGSVGGRAGATSPGLPVVLGAADSVLGAYGLGVTDWGDVAYLAGSSTVILGVSPDLVRDHRHRYLVTPLAIGPGWGLEMDLLSTGSAVRWLASTGRVDEAGLLELADSVDPTGPNLPVFLPYLAPGEQGALWDPALSGSLVGLDLSHGRAEVARALLTGILVESRRCLSVLETASGGAGPVHVAGHTTGGGFGQDLADATGRDVITSAVGGDASALGAALLARTVLGHGAREPWLRTETTVHPRAGRAAAWQRVADRHDATLRTVRNLRRREAVSP